MSDENRPAGARPQQRESRAVGRAKPIKPGREMKQGAPGPKTTEQAGKARQAVQAAARNGQAKARFTQTRTAKRQKRAVDTTKRATDAARAGMRALVEALHSLLIALAAGGSVAVLIVVLISPDRLCRRIGLRYLLCR